VFSSLSVPRGYKGTKKVVWEIRQELSQVLEMAVKGDREEMARKEIDGAKKTSCVLQLQWDWYNYCVESRCQDATNEDWEI
jgi:hypothetical protein